MALTQQEGRDQVLPLSLQRTDRNVVSTDCDIVMMTDTYPLLFDHIFNLLHGRVPIITSKIKKNTKRSNPTTSSKRIS